MYMYMCMHCDVATCIVFVGPSNGNNSGGQSTGNSVPDCRGMVKTLVCGMKTITWGAGSCKLPGSAIDYCESGITYIVHVHVYSEYIIYTYMYMYMTCTLYIFACTV